MTSIALTPTSSDPDPTLADVVELTGAPSTAASAAPAGTLLDPARLARAKTAYTTRFLAHRLEQDASGVRLLAGPDVQPRSGDVVLARVAEIGQHKRLESPASRRATLFPGDEVVVAYGHRYAPDQFEAEVPDDLGPAHLVAAGGLVGRVTAQHAAIDDATVLEPVGLLADDDGVLTLERLAPRSVPDLPPSGTLPRRAPVLAVLGSSMNSGKSTTLACLVRGLSLAGYRVGAGKVTGTGAGGDPRLFTDAGASSVLDFTDFGQPSTYRLDHARVRGLLGALVTELDDAGSDVVVLEVADGIFQQETARLLEDPLFGSAVDRVVFAAADALGATAGVRRLVEGGHDVVACSGVVTASPLAAGEARAAVEVPVIDTYDLTDPAMAQRLLS